MHSPIEGEGGGGSGFVLMGPGVYYFLGGTMSCNLTTTHDLLLERNELIAFQHADGEIRRGVEEVIYFMGSDFDAVVHDLLEKSGVVFETRFPTPDDLEALSEDSKLRVVVLDDWMNRILEEPGYVDMFTKLVHHRRLMLFVIQQVLFPPQRQAVSLRSNASVFFLFKFSTELGSVRRLLSHFLHGAELTQAWEYYKEWIEEPGGYIFVYKHPLKPYDITFFADISADWTQFLPTS